ncbi:MAG: response regulator transcription factor [Flavobacterium sp.]|nr:MAG: response regulator transcription factor [Flavobacterium sp.]
MITIAIAEDHQSLIDGMKLFMEYEDDISVVGEANDGEALIDIVRRKRPDIVLTDIRMPKCDGISAVGMIKKEFPTTKVIAFSMFEQEEAMDQMTAAGASGYIMKNSSLRVVLAAIRTVAKGGTYFDAAIKARVPSSKEAIFISSREKQILKLIGEGRSSQEIADALFIGKSTVDTHRKNIIRKLDLHGKTELIRYAMECKYDF